VTGTSNLASINFGQPVYVTDTWLVQLNGAYGYGNSESDFSAFPVTQDRYSKTTGGFSATVSDANYAFTVSPAANAIDWHNEILDNPRSFDTFTGNSNAFIKLPDHFSISALGSWQYTWQKLLPGDQLFSIGGPTTVRGYPSNSAAGDSGYYFNFEVHRDMSEFVPGLDVYGFVDSGSVYSTFPRTTQLDGAGAGLSWSPIAALTFEASGAVPWRFDIAGQPHSVFYGRVTFRPLLL
jgi:hemolysin activation/secretion protein